MIKKFLLPKELRQKGKSKYLHFRLKEERLANLSELYHKYWKKFVFIGWDGWPVEGIINRPFKTFLRRFFLTNKIMRYKTWLDKGGFKINFN